MSQKSRKFISNQGNEMRWISKDYFSKRKKRRQMQRRSRQINRRRGK